MAREVRNSAQLPILRLIFEGEKLTASEVSDRLISQGYYFQPAAVRMNLKRYANAGIIGRELDFVDGWRRQFSYYANFRTVKRLQYLENNPSKYHGPNQKSNLSWNPDDSAFTTALLDGGLRTDQPRLYQYALTNALLDERRRRKESDSLLTYAHYMAMQSQRRERSMALSLALLPSSRPNYRSDQVRGASEILAEIRAERLRGRIRDLESSNEDLKRERDAGDILLAREIADGKKKGEEIRALTDANQGLTKQLEQAESQSLGFALRIEALQEGVVPLTPDPFVEAVIRLLALDTLKKRLTPGTLLDWMMSANIFQLLGRRAARNRQASPGWSEPVDPEMARMFEEKFAEMKDEMMKEDPGLAGELGLAFQDTEGRELLNLVKTGQLQGCKLAFGPLVSRGKRVGGKTEKLRYGYSVEVATGSGEDVDRVKGILKEKGIDAEVTLAPNK